MLGKDGIPLGRWEYVDVHARGLRRFHLRRWLLLLRLSTFRENVENAHEASSLTNMCGRDSNRVFPIDTDSPSTLLNQRLACHSRRSMPGPIQPPNELARVRHNLSDSLVSAAGESTKKRAGVVTTGEWNLKKSP
jgi:hypothetical protein